MSSSFAPPFGDLRRHATGRVPTVLAATPLAKRQTSQCNEPEETPRRPDSETFIPLAYPSPLVSLPGGSPTTTMTKTLYSAGQITSTQSEGGSSSGGGGKTGTTAPSSFSSLQSFSMNVAPFMGVAISLSGPAGVAASDNNSSPTTVTTTGTSTVYSTVTLVSTRISTTTIHDPSTWGNLNTKTPLISLIGSNASSSTAPGTPSKLTTTTTSSTATSSSGIGDGTDAHQQTTTHGGTIAGATIGTMAAFGMIGFLLWFCCVKKKGRRKLKVKLDLKRRKTSSAVKAAQLEDQAMEETRRVMLEQRTSEVNGFLKGVPPRPPPPPSNPLAVELPAGEVDGAAAAAALLPVPLGLRSEISASGTESTRTHPSWIGVAATSSTPPGTPPLPRSNSQKTPFTSPSVTAASTGGSPYVCSPLTLNDTSSTLHQRIPSSLLPRPLKPAALVTTPPNLARPEHVSPLSPRGMFNALGNTTSRAWQRASQVLSPVGGYARIGEDERIGRGSVVTLSAGGSAKRRDSKPRNPELEIGRQTDVVDGVSGGEGKGEVRTGWI